AGSASVGASPLLVPRGLGSGPGQRGEIARGRPVRTLDTRTDLSLVAVPELRKIRRPPVCARGQDMHADVVGQSRHLLVEPVPAGDLEGDQADLPGPAGHGQLAL